VREIHRGDCFDVLPKLRESFARLVYIDPPFNTGEVQKRNRMKVAKAEAGDAGGRRGFHGLRYAVKRIKSASYGDQFDDYVGFLLPRIQLALRCMTPDASIFVHLDAREVHYVKVALDGLFGRDSFRN
jgi:site-specific DNA-methyltransferase (adenine-specific)